MSVDNAGIHQEVAIAPPPTKMDISTSTIQMDSIPSVVALENEITVSSVAPHSQVCVPPVQLDRSGVRLSR
jgi:hypothetical protein